MLYDDLNLLLGFDETVDFDKDSEPDEEPESERVEKEDEQMAAHYTLTLTGSAQKLSTAISGDATDSIPASPNFMSLHADSGNTHVIYVGGTNATLTSSNFGFRIEAPVTSIPPAPFIRELTGNSRNLQNFYVLGTNTEKLHIFID